MKHARGMTMIEVLMVVAIIGTLSALAAVGLTSMTRMGRVNGAAGALARVAANVRSRAINEHCRYVMQVNGNRYAPNAAGLQRVPNVILVYRKGNCASTVPAFEPGLTANQDQLIDQLPLAEFRTELTLPTTVLAGEQLTTGALAISWNEVGQRAISSDDDADGVFDVSADTSTITITIRPEAAVEPDAPSRAVLIPFAGRPSAQ